MVIEAEGYYPQLVNIYVPNQTYFYELFQEIFLKQIRVSQNDSIIGQEITVTNTFYNIYKTQIADSIYESNQQIKNKSFDELLKVVEEIINTSDSIGLDHLDSISSIYTNQIPDKNKNTSLKNYDDLLSKIEEAINTEDSASLYLLDANAVYNDVTNKVYFFDANTFSPYLSPVIIGNDTLYTLPSLNASERDNPNIDQDSLKEHILVRTKRSEFKNIPDSLRRFVYINYVYYESGKSDINKKYSMLVNGVAQLLLLNENLGIELHGYTDVIGDEVKNFELSKTRAFNVMEYLVSKQVDSKRIIMVAHGETGTSDANNIPDLKQQRRVEIKIFEVKK
jgi:outer membrane protein OmpA-like peptidoglycan-associated protein